MNDFDRIVAEVMEPCIIIGCVYHYGHEGKHKMSNYLYGSLEECEKSGSHNTSCDDDGYCNNCGNQSVTEQKYFVYGSGMFGCLYDYGPNFCLDKDDAISSFIQLFIESLEPGELTVMVENLKEDGIHSFRNPNKAGAHYCQISEESGEIPENNDD